MVEKQVVTCDVADEACDCQMKLGRDTLEDSIDGNKSINCTMKVTKFIFTHDR